MKLLLILLAKIFNSLPKTDFILVHWCRLYESYGLESPNLVGMNDAPTVTSTSPATNIATTTVTASGNITATGGENPSTRGVCYVAGAGTPTLSDTVNSENGTFGTGAFSRNLTGLSPGTLYTFRAFATNSVGTSFGANVQFTTLTDIRQTETAFYEDGTENGSAVIDTGADSITRDVSSGDSNLQLRVRLQNNGAALLSTDDYQLQYEKNDSGTWENVDQIGLPIVQDSHTDNVANLFNILGGTATSSEGNQAQGQSFTTSSAYDLVQIDVALAKESSPTDNLTVAVYSGSINGTLLGTSDAVDGSTLTTSSAYISFNFSSSIGLTSGTKYYFQVTRSGVRDTTNFYRVYGDSDSGYSGHGTYTRVNNAWGSESSSLDMAFKTYGSPTPGTEVIGFNSGSLTDGNATTNRLGAGTGSFVAGEISEDGLVDNLQITASNYTELLYSLTIDASEVADNDTLDFRVLRNGATTGMTYTVTPRITIEKGGGAPATRRYSLTTLGVG